jgi:hypothetical protein
MDQKGAGPRCARYIAFLTVKRSKLTQHESDRHVFSYNFTQYAVTVDKMDRGDLMEKYVTGQKYCKRL